MDPSTSSAGEAVPVKNKKICEVCGQADRRPTTSFLQNIVTCEACKKFLERCQRQNKVKLRCKNGGRRGMTCNLATDRPCAKCRLDKAIQLVTKMKASSSSTPLIGAAALTAALRDDQQVAALKATPASQLQQKSEIASSSSAAANVADTKKSNLNEFFQKCAETNTIETVKHLQLKVELLKYLKKSPHLTDIHQQNTAVAGSSTNSPVPVTAVASASPGAGHQPLEMPYCPTMPGPMVIDTMSTYGLNIPNSNQTVASYYHPTMPLQPQMFSSRTDGRLATPSPSSSSQSSPSPAFFYVDQHQNLPMFFMETQPSTSSAMPLLQVAPTLHDNVRNEIVLRRIMQADSALTAKKYKCDASYLKNKGIPDEENEFWKLVSWCIQDIALANLPFATQLAGSLCRISHIDMCRLVEHSYCLMFYAQTGLPNRLDVVSAFSQLFTKMRHAWKEIDVIMDHTREIVTAIREWKPSSTEFAFLLATIFCNSVRKDKVMVPETLTQLEHLTDSVMSAAQAHMTQTHGQGVAQIRYQQLQCIIKAVIKLREGRLYALRRFYERNPQLAKQTVHPVIELVCRQFRDAWQQDYCSVQLPCYPPPINYELKRGVDQFTEVIMNNI